MHEEFRGNRPNPESKPVTGGNMQPTEILTIDDLVNAFVEYDKYKGCNKKVAGYYGTRLELLKSLLQNLV